jgi:hypothetical protein
MSQLNERQNQASSSHIYYDVCVSNLQSTTISPKIFQYNDTRTVPFIKNPEDYVMSIVRFTLDTNSLPVFIPQIQTDQADRDLTIYSITLAYDGYEKQVFVDWNPQLVTAPLAPPPSQTVNKQQYNQDGYYNCYSYSWFIERVYQAFVVAFEDLVANAGVPPPPVVQGDVGTFPPVLSWDATTNSATLFADSEWYAVNDVYGNGVIEIFMNAPLFALFSTFPATFRGYEGVTNGKNYKLPLVDIGGTNCTQIIPPGQQVPVAPNSYLSWRAITWTQEQSTIANWSAILSIVFTSNTLPIDPAQNSTPLVFSNGLQVSLGGNNSDLANVITDIVSVDGNYRPNLVYNPSAEYRRIALKGNRPLYNLDINIFYKLMTGELVPFRLLSNESMTMKILFEKKENK